MMQKPKGWTKESYRHYLAAKGVATGRRYNAVNISLTKSLAKNIESREGERKAEKESRLKAAVAQTAAQSEVAKQTLIAPLTSGEETRRRENILRQQQSAKLQSIRLLQEEIAGLDARSEELEEMSKHLQLVPLEGAAMRKYGPFEVGPSSQELKRLEESKRKNAEVEARRAEFVQKYNQLEEDVEVLLKVGATQEADIDKNPRGPLGQIMSAAKAAEERLRNAQRNAQKEGIEV